MEYDLKSLLPGDPKLIDGIVNHLKCEGIFDEFRKSCLADVDTKPAYQNLRTRVESCAVDYLKNTQWRPDLNKNQLRDRLRRQINDSGMLTSGVDRIIDQIVTPKIVPFFLPKIVEIVYRSLGIVKQENSSLTASPAVTGDVKQNADLTPTPNTPIKEEALKSKTPAKPEKLAPRISKTNKNGCEGTKSNSESKSPSSGKSKAQLGSKNEGNKNVKLSDGVRSSKKEVSPKRKSTELSKDDENSSRKSAESKSGSQAAKSSTVDDKESKKGVKHVGKDEAEKSKSEKMKHCDKNKSSKPETKEETKTKQTEKSKLGEKGFDNKNKTTEKQKNAEGEKSKLKDSSSNKDNVASKKAGKSFEKALMSSDGDKISSSQSSKSPIIKDEKSSGKKEVVKGCAEEKPASSKDKLKTTNKKGDSRSADKKCAVEGRSAGKEKSSEAQSLQVTKERLKRKSEDEGSQDSKKAKLESLDSPSFRDKLKEKMNVINADDEGELSDDVTVSSVHTSDLSDYDDHISMSDGEDEESESQNKSTTKSPKKDKLVDESRAETDEDKRAGLKISEDALMSSDELRTAVTSNKEDTGQSEPKRELRRQRKVNPKYTSEDFSTIFSNNHEKPHYQNHGDEAKMPVRDSKGSSQTSTGQNSIDKLVETPNSDTPSEMEETTKQGSTANLSSDDDGSSSSSSSNSSSSSSSSKRNASGDLLSSSSPKVLESGHKGSQIKLKNRNGSSSEEETSSHKSIGSQSSVQKDDSSNTKRSTKSDALLQRQRYDNADLYKPRLATLNSRRRANNALSTERRDYIENDSVSFSDRISPQRRTSSNEAASPIETKNSPKDPSESHTPMSKRCRQSHN